LIRFRGNRITSSVRFVSSWTKWQREIADGEMAMS